jgi:hypothetical protein
VVVVGLATRSLCYAVCNEQHVSHRLARHSHPIRLYAFACVCVVYAADAYYYLHFGEQCVDVSTAPGTAGLPKSILSMDTDGRVIRLDSLSKFVAPGVRIGWIAGAPQFTEKYQLLQEMTSQFPSSVSQVCSGSMSIFSCVTCKNCK